MEMDGKRPMEHKKRTGEALKKSQLRIKDSTKKSRVL